MQSNMGAAIGIEDVVEANVVECNAPFDEHSVWLWRCRIKLPARSVHWGWRSNQTPRYHRCKHTAFACVMHDDAG